MAQSPKSLTADFTFATHNTERGAAEFRPLADIVLWQELSDPEDRGILVVTLLDYDHAIYNDAEFGPGMNSISWDMGVFDLDADPARPGKRRAPLFRRASEDKLGVSPARFVTYALLRHKATGLRVAAINCHFISKPRSDPWRAEQWANNLRVLGNVIRDVTADGYVPLVGGDLNLAVWDLIPGLTEPRFEPLTVDRIGVPAGVKATARLGTNGGSNHQPVIATLSITKE